MATMEKLISGARGLGLDLDAHQLEKFESYYRELIDWNMRVNLTRIVEYEAVQAKHFLDSLTVVKALPSGCEGPLKILDVGTGAGFPGVPLKIVCPEMQLYLMDSVRKKTLFLEHLLEVLNLEKVCILTGRAEALGHEPTLREAFDIVVARAVAGMASLLELTLPFCRVGGKVIAQKEVSYRVERGDAEKALEVLGGRRGEEILVQVPGIRRERCLVLISKVRATPAGYPRRAGVPVKHPL